MFGIQYSKDWMFSIGIPTVFVFNQPRIIILTFECYLVPRCAHPRFDRLLCISHYKINLFGTEYWRRELKTFKYHKSQLQLSKHNKIHSWLNSKFKKSTMHPFDTLFVMFFLSCLYFCIYLFIYWPVKKKEIHILSNFNSYVKDPSI